MFEMYVKFVESSSKYELELPSVLCTITATYFDPCAVYLTCCDRLDDRYFTPLSIIFFRFPLRNEIKNLK